MTRLNEITNYKINKFYEIEGEDTYLPSTSYFKITNKLIKNSPNNEAQEIQLKNAINTFLKENTIASEPPKQPPPQEVVASFQVSVLSYSVLQTESARKEACRQYSVVMYSVSSGPAMLYKLKDILDMPPSWGQALFTLDRIYKPSGHTWNNNSVWMLAHIHKQSEFMVMSAVTTSNLMRRCDSGHYSAFARELATAMLAGYQVTRITYEHHHQITHLTPTKTREEALAVTIMDCRADAGSCQKGISLYYSSVAMYQSTHQMVSKLTPEPSTPKNNEPFLKNFRSRNEFKLEFLNSGHSEDDLLKKRIFLNSYSISLFNKISNDKVLNLPANNVSEEDSNFKKFYLQR